MHFHGGGWVLGDVNTHDRLIREIAVGAHAAVVFVDYDRAPEVQFPIPLEEAYAVTKYVAENEPPVCPIPWRSKGRLGGFSQGHVSVPSYRWYAQAKITPQTPFRPRPGAQKSLRRADRRHGR
jgi:hypothetical protein